VQAAIDYARGKTSQPDPQPHGFEAPTQAAIVPGSAAAAAAPAGQPQASAAAPGSASDQFAERVNALAGAQSPERNRPVNAATSSGSIMGAVGGRLMEPRVRSGDPVRPEQARLRLPVDLSAWIVLPGWPAVDWARPDTELVRVYPAAPDRGCPPAGPAVVDSVLASPARARDALAERLRPGQTYRVELGSGERLRLGCIRVATLEQERDVFARLRAVRADYARAVPDGDAAGLALVEAATLAGDGFYGDALLRLQPVVARADAPAVAVQLWAAIVAQEKLLLPDR
jgi:hypothetical protein